MIGQVIVLEDPIGMFLFKFQLRIARLGIHFKSDRFEERGVYSL